MTAVIKDFGCISDIINKIIIGDCIDVMKNIEDSLKNISEEKEIIDIFDNLYLKIRQ